MTYKFKMSGGLGDIIFALPTMRALGGGSLCICPSEFTENSLHSGNAVAPRSMFTQMKTLLLTATDYIDLVEVSDQEEEASYDLNRFRLRSNLAGPPNLAAMILETFECNPQDAMRSWLDLPVQDPFGVVMSRTARYHTLSFPWAAAAEKYSRDLMFVGTLDEHRAFAREFNTWVPWRYTANMLDLANEINGSQLFIGNQSVAYAIAEGLKHSAVLELVHQNNNFERAAVVINPTVDQLPNLP